MQMNSSMSRGRLMERGHELRAQSRILDERVPAGRACWRAVGRKTSGGRKKGREEEEEEEE